MLAELKKYRLVAAWQVINQFTGPYKAFCTNCDAEILAKDAVCRDRCPTCGAKMLLVWYGPGPLELWNWFTQRKHT